MMAETTKADKAPKPSYIKGLKAEFKKVVWPDQETVAKQSLTVVAITLALSSGSWTLLSNGDSALLFD